MFIAYLEQANKEVAAAAAAVLNDELDSAEAVLLLNNDETTWRGLVFDKFKRILDELKTLQANPNENVSERKHLRLFIAPINRFSYKHFLESGN